MAGDAGADVAAFVADHGQELTRFAFLVTGGRAEESEDLVQSVLAKLAERGLDGIQDPAAYVRRGIINRRNSLGRRAATLRRLWPRLAAGAPSHAEPSGIDDRLTILAALRELTARQRTAIVLRYYESRADDEIALVIGCSRSTVRSLVRRGLAGLRRELGETYTDAATLAGRVDDDDDVRE